MAAIVYFDQDDVSQFVRVIGSDLYPRWRRQYALNHIKRFDRSAGLERFNPSIGGYRVTWGGA